MRLEPFISAVWIKRHLDAHHSFLIHVKKTWTYFDDIFIRIIFVNWFWFYLLGGNVHGSQDQYTYTNEKKDYQWLGATMDGSAGDNDKFVVSLEAK